MVIYGIFIMAVGKAAMHRSYLYPHNPTFGALSQGRARFFYAKAGVALLFQYKLCWAHELRSNTPCPGSTFSCTDCLVHTNRAGGSPLTDGGFFAEPQLGVALCGARGFAAPAAGAKRKDNLRFSFLFELLPFPCFLIRRRLPICDRFENRERQSGYCRVTFFAFSQFTDSVLLHRRLSLRRRGTR